MSTTIAENVQIWRQKVQDGTITTEEMRLALAAIRGERVAAGATSSASREKKAGAVAKGKAAPIDSDALLGELDL